MNKLRKNQAGFSAVELVLVLIIVVLIGVVGFMVYKNHTKVASQKTATTNAKAVSPVKKKTNPQVDAYAGWQQYCSSVGKLCLKYPSDWKIDTQSYTAEQSASLEMNHITNPSGTISVEYILGGSIGGTGNPLSIYVANVGNAQSASLKVITLIDKYTGTPLISSPYTLEGFVTTNPKTAAGDTFSTGATLSSSYEPSIRHFKPDSSSVNIQLSIQDKKDGFASQQEAQSELNSSDFQTAVKILSSASYAQ